MSTMSEYSEIDEENLTQKLFSFIENTADDKRQRQTAWCVCVRAIMLSVDTDWCRRFLQRLCVEYKHVSGSCLRNLYLIFQKSSLAFVGKATKSNWTS